MSPDDLAFKFDGKSLAIGKRGLTPTIDAKGRLWLLDTEGRLSKTVDFAGEKITLHAVVKIYAKPTRAQVVRMVRRVSKHKRSIT